MDCIGRMIPGLHAMCSNATSSGYSARLFDGQATYYLARMRLANPYACTTERSNGADRVSQHGPPTGERHYTNTHTHEQADG